MKFGRLTSVFYTIIRLGSRDVLGSSFYSTKPSTAWKFRGPGEDNLGQLYRRISPVGDHKVSIVPILDQWIEEGRSVNRFQLIGAIKELRYYKRYSHALEILTWMTDKRYFALCSPDIALRLDLMSKVHGIEEAEKYFNNVPQKLKVVEVYGGLLHCYAHATHVEKAEALMQKMRDLGFDRTLFTYNDMLNLYYRTGNFEKLDALVHEMEENGIVYDKITISLQLSAYAAVSNIEGMEKVIKKMESDRKIVLDWITYSAAATGYAKAGLADKALEMLKKSERLITSKRSRAYEGLITQYATLGKKDEVLRIWELYRKKEKVYNKGYTRIITSLLKFDDIESAEKIFEEWESQNLFYDIQIPNCLIGAYSRKGLLERAENLIDRAVSKGGKTNALTWCHLATGYLLKDQTAQAVETMKKAKVVLQPDRMPSKERLASCLENLKGEENFEKVEEFIKLLMDNGIISLDMKERLLNHIKAKNSGSAHEFWEPDGDVSDFILEEKH
ncbi:hypothetical protein JCGZ_03056 [Jatropha curcas]|uniref:Pentatricopeptide repeat-containing protein-mitochondrial domain-containing protein n=2 Tax=Jatropha curcas TaxID=180498 RepID=A0A067JGJ7_JATCU|nr:hypothetical protein JCGZ_03056 [Jatropha curcas]